MHAHSHHCRHHSYAADRTGHPKGPSRHHKCFAAFCQPDRGDILVREELEAMAEKKDQFSLWYTLDRAPEGTVCNV